MLNLTSEFIQNEVADSGVIYKRGQRLYRNGAFVLQEKNVEDGIFVYNVDGNYDDYTTAVEMTNGTVKTSCDCPYPGTGCKHTVAILLDLRDMLGRWREPDEDDDPCLTPEEIRQQALEDRAARAKNEELWVTEGDTLKGEHLVKTLAGLQLKMDLFQGVFEEGEDQVEFSQEKRNELLNKLRDMMEEEPVAPVKESGPAEEIPDDAPGYLNPEVLEKEVLEKTDGSVDYTAEETGAEIDHRSEGSAGGAETDSSPEKMEAVLNSGMQFMSGLMEMATGRKMSATGSDDQMIKVDRETGEVTMKFKLPGF